MEENTKSPVAVSPGEKTSVSVIGDTYRILISGKETESDFATIEMLIPPGGGPPPHSHADVHESFYVLEGEVEVTSEKGKYTAIKDSYILIPKGGIVHCFKNKTDSVARLLCTVTPSGMEEMFLEIGLPVANGEFLPPPVMTPDSIKQMTTIAEKYGQQVYPPDYFEK